MRSGRWKLHFSHRALVLNGKLPGQDGKPAAQVELPVGNELYDLERDPGEKLDLSAAYPRTVRRLQRMADGMRRELGDTATKQLGRGNRSPGRSDPAKL